MADEGDDGADVRRHLRVALERSEDSEARYHIRQALQHVVE